MIITIASIIVAFIIVVWAYMQQPQFGRRPAGDRLAQITGSPNYKDGAFQNQSHTPSFTNGGTFLKVSRKFFFEKSKRSAPTTALQATKVDLKQLDPREDVIVWFGHSSYYMQVGGKRMLVDPVLSGSASPVSFTTRSFAGTDIYTADDMPEIDVLFITHDHYDHLDHKTVAALNNKVKAVVTGLGVGAHLERWGYDPRKIIERDWHQEVDLGDGFRVFTAPARHFSGRGFKRNVTLWSSFVLYTPQHKIYIGGDSGYDTHFAEIGKMHGPFDLAILENGQYNDYWQNIHMMPEETVQAAIDLGARTLFPVHWSKFALSLHDWDESIKRVVAEADRKGMPLIHPSIGEPVNLQRYAATKKWWENYV
ncbi:MBL fold metallo-hydrolase [Nemorincola caseinilytica]|uniref:MBL fold metallo-hydrolase n=1 Tax=Nemorincola caseinilytica TaxID=2054315 RepID=A0ABP8NJ99_9BACT